jgi:HD-like signal output (HDOD) protein
VTERKLSRVVFVDDDSNILQGMRRTMHCMRSEWNMEFLPSGAAALESLAKSPADVIVSDMRMPGMDGWQLLTEVKKLHPGTVRFVLSGHADPAAIMRSVGVAHQYLAKPCDGVTLKLAIAQSEMLKSILGNESLAQLVGDVDTLPSCPRAFQEITKHLQQPNATVADVARIIGRDPGMTANLMKLVNSAFFGTRQSITTVDRAVTYLGLDTLGALVLGHSLFYSNDSGNHEAGALHGLWLHSLQTATAARTIAVHEKLPRAQAEAAFLAGMMHDVGKLVFATRSIPTKSEGTISNHAMIALVEERHAAMGAYLLGLWAFPSPLIEAVAQHHTPTQQTTSGLDLTVLVHVANRLSHRSDRSVLDPIELGIEPGLLEELGLLNHLPLWSAALDELDSVQAGG